MAKTPKSEDFGFEDPLESLLDEESDEEFGLPEFKEHLADELTPAVLKDWTAQDFASIYVRFRPHLERHARRFLNNQTQVEEVVQDAFLYLMTTLPELDSELGVLKFLKWKTRLLALDVIRANSKRYLAPLDDQLDLAADMPEIGSELERAEDAAIVSLALAKLQPRHREALIASVYEEKSTDVVAAQLGLSENATRQLLFRARAAFKKALVGEAETAGLSISQILSLAAKKAAKESGKILGAAGTFLLVLAISLGVIPGLVSPEPTQEPSLSATAENPATTSELEASPAPEATEVAPLAEVPGSQQVFVAQPAVAVSTPKPSPSAEEEERAYLTAFVRDILDRDALKQFSASNTGVILQSSGTGKGSVVVSNNSGLTAHISYNLDLDIPVHYLWINLAIDGLKFDAVPKASISQKRVDPTTGNTIIEYMATDLLVGDTQGSFNFVAVDNSAVSFGYLQIQLELDPEGNVVKSSLSLTSRS